MKKEHFTFKSDDIDIHCMKFIPENKIKAVVQIAHGMAEHKNRYEYFANKLVENNFAVYINDHRGHGENIKNKENEGFFAKNNGWDKLLIDMNSLNKIIKKDYPHKNIFLFGHSMGSILTRSYLNKYYSQNNKIKELENLKGVILSGSPADPKLKGKIGKTLAQLNSLLGKRKKSPFLNHISFNSFNNKFKPTKTKFDWLSRDENSVNEYINDPLCGQIFTVSAYLDIVKAMINVYSDEFFENFEKNLPLFIISGSKDPVGNNSKGIIDLYNKYKKYNLKDIYYKLYPDARHEILQEINKNEIIEDIINWLEKYV